MQAVTQLFATQLKPKFLKRATQLHNSVFVYSHWANAPAAPLKQRSRRARKGLGLGRGLHVLETVEHVWLPLPQ